MAFLYDGKLRFVGTMEESRQSTDPRLQEFLRVGIAEGSQ
jgi:ABC-type transporter Mla maintaining outer membrane lipid asymmetry ATPase subunit MlaF